MPKRGYKVPWLLLVTVLPLGDFRISKKANLEVKSFHLGSALLLANKDWVISLDASGLLVLRRPYTIILDSISREAPEYLA